MARLFALSEMRGEQSQAAERAAGAQPVAAPPGPPPGGGLGPPAATACSYFQPTLRGDMATQACGTALQALILVKQVTPAGCLAPDGACPFACNPLGNKPMPAWPRLAHPVCSGAERAHLKPSLCRWSVWRTSLPCCSSSSCCQGPTGATGTPACLAPCSCVPHPSLHGSCVRRFGGRCLPRS